MSCNLYSAECQAGSAVFSLPEKLKAVIKQEFDLYLSVSWQLHCFVYKFKIFIRIKEAIAIACFGFSILFSSHCIERSHIKDLGHVDP